MKEPEVTDAEFEVITPAQPKRRGIPRYVRLPFGLYFDMHNFIWIGGLSALAALRAIVGP